MNESERRVPRDDPEGVSRLDQAEGELRLAIIALQEEVKSLRDRVDALEKFAIYSRD